MKGFIAMLYYCMVVFGIFCLFNGKNPQSWDGLVQFGCGFWMMVMAILAHAVYWKEDHEKKGGKS